VERILGVIIEMPVNEGHDLLAAYEDGSARYLNYSGKALVYEAQVPEVQVAISNWITVAGSLVKAIGPWTDPELPALPPGHLRVLMLTPGGPSFGQGPAEAISSDALARGFIDAATTTLQAILRQA
jgi:hypothetical protein